MRLSVSLSASRAQLTSSSGVGIWFFRAQISRCAQHASIWSLPPTLSTPKSRNGPICSRGRCASSRTTGIGGGWFFAISVVSCQLSVVTRWATDDDYGLSSHRMTQLDLAIDVFGKVADDAAVLVAGDELQALVGDAAELEELVFEIAHHFAHGRPVNLVAGQAAHLIVDLIHLLGELVGHAAHEGDDVADHAQGAFLDAQVAGVLVEDLANLAEGAVDVFERADVAQVQLVEIELRIVGANFAQAAERAPRFVVPLELRVQVIEPFERVGVGGANAVRFLPVAQGAVRALFRGALVGQAVEPVEGARLDLPGQGGRRRAAVEQIEVAVPVGFGAIEAALPLVGESEVLMQPNVVARAFESGLEIPRAHVEILQHAGAAAEQVEQGDLRGARDLV